jgi:NAD(P)-dependent dehydrogenase (short-subunit alcohol dehydrogenase family)
MGRPEEVAQTILFLASDNSPLITGQIFGVDGGKMA